MKVKIVGSTWVVSDDAVFRFLRLHHVCLIYSVLYIYIPQGQQCGAVFKYVIVLTKADKNGNTVVRSVLEATVKV